MTLSKHSIIYVYIHTHTYICIFAKSDAMQLQTKKRGFCCLIQPRVLLFEVCHPPLEVYRHSPSVVVAGGYWRNRLHWLGTIPLLHSQRTRARIFREQDWGSKIWYKCPKTYKWHWMIAGFFGILITFNWLNLAPIWKWYVGIGTNQETVRLATRESIYLVAVAYTTP